MSQHNDNRIRELAKELKELKHLAPTANFTNYRLEIVSEELDKRMALQ